LEAKGNITLKFKFGIINKAFTTPTFETISGCRDAKGRPTVKIEKKDYCVK
jgi:hypothetical protein